MKYIKKYESFDYNANKKFPTDIYIISTYREHEQKSLFLAKVLPFSRYDRNDYISIKYIDYISDRDRDLSGKNDVLYIPKLNTIYYKSKSLEDAQKRFDKMKEQKPYCDWIIEKEMKKYNI